MSLLKRVIICIKRKFAQNILLFLIILLIGILVSGAISIGRAIERTEENVWRQLPAIAMVDQDWLAAELHWQEYGNWPAPPITVEMVEQVVSLPYIRDVEITFTSQFHNRGLSRYWETNSEMQDDIFSLASWGIQHVEDFIVRGVSAPSFLELTTGMISIFRGTTFTEEQIETRAPVVMISHELAAENNLDVGSTISLEAIVTSGTYDFTASWFDDKNIFNSLEIDFEVIGIFESTMPISDDINDETARLELLNTFFAPYTILIEMETFRIEAFGMDASRIEESLGFSNYLLLYDARDLPALREAASEILPEFIVTADVSDSFSDVMTSMEHVRSVSTVVLLLAISGSVIILSLVIILFLRDRRHEIGIYLSLGEHKKKIVLQFLFEIMLITVVAVSLSLFIGSFLSSGLSQNMLIQELSNMRDGSIGNGNQFMIGNTIFTDNREIIRFSPDPLSSEELIELFDTSMDSEQVLIFYGIAIITIMLSTVVPMVYVLRLEPKEILL